MHVLDCIAARISYILLAAMQSSLLYIYCSGYKVLMVRPSESVAWLASQSGSKLEWRAVVSLPSLVGVCTEVLAHVCGPSRAQYLQCSVYCNHYVPVLVVDWSSLRDQEGGGGRQICHNGDMGKLREWGRGKGGKRKRGKEV